MGSYLGFFCSVLNLRKRQQPPFFVFNGLLPLQVDLLKTTALPLMKKFGVDGEKFDLKVRMRLLVNNRGVTFICHAAAL